MKLSHLIDFNGIAAEDFVSLCLLAEDIQKKPVQYAGVCAGKVMATLFYEPSTRTQFSFQTAMLRLGGSHIGFSDPGCSSVSKGESVKDTVKIVSGYCDLAVIRSPLEGAAYAASLYSDVPVINAGDGGHLHPTQTMADLFTILKEKGGLEGLHIGICGDLLNGRTVHSLLKAFSLRQNNHFYLISTPELSLPGYIYSCFEGTGNRIKTCSSLEECIGCLDVLYMTRIQRERFQSDAEYKKQTNVFVLDKHRMTLAKPDLCVLHPLPKVDEISHEVDGDPRAKYFEQAKNGMYIRMALIIGLLENVFIPREVCRPAAPDARCENPRCVTNHEKYLPHIAGQNGQCAYCEHQSLRVLPPRTPAP